MKLLMLPAFCFCSVFVSAQSSDGNDAILKKSELLKKYKQGQLKTDSLPDQFNQYFRRYEFDVTISPKQNNVISLSQDNMPCVIPDTNSIAVMPNAWGNISVPYRSLYNPIPNPGIAPKKPRLLSHNSNTDQTK